MNKQLISDKLASWQERMWAVPPKLATGSTILTGRAAATACGEGFALPGCEFVKANKQYPSPISTLRRELMRSLKWFVLRGAPVAAILSPLLILHSNGAFTDSIRYTELRLGDLIQANSANSEPEPAPSAEGRGPAGRPLNMDETPISHPPSQRGILLRKIRWVNDEIGQLQADGLERQASLMKAELGRVRRMPEFSDSSEQATRKMSAVLAPLVSHVEQARLRRGLVSAKEVDIEGFYRAASADVRKHGAILPGQYYFAEGDAAGIEQVTPVSLPASWTSYASGGSFVYFCTADGLYSLDRNSGAVNSLWYPGKTVPKHIAIDGDKTFMLVRGDKDYRFELTGSTWTVLDSLHLPEGPVGLSTNGSRIYIPGRIDNGLLGYIHVYSGAGVLVNTIKLQYPINIANRDCLRLVMNSDESKIAFISENNTGSRDLVLLDLEQGRVVHSGKLGLINQIRFVIR